MFGERKGAPGADGPGKTKGGLSNQFKKALALAKRHPLGAALALIGAGAATLVPFLLSDDEGVDVQPMPGGADAPTTDPAAEVGEGAGTGALVTAGALAAAGGTKYAYDKMKGRGPRTRGERKTAKAKAAAEPQMRIGPTGQATAVGARPASNTRRMVDMAKKVPKAGPLLGTAFGAMEYMDAESDAERTDAIMSNVVGALAAGGAGAVVGGGLPGFIAGLIAWYVGAEIGGFGADLLSDAADSVPDSVKVSAESEIAHIDDMLADEGMSPEDRESLLARKRELAMGPSTRRSRRRRRAALVESVPEVIGAGGDLSIESMAALGPASGAAPADAAPGKPKAPRSTRRSRRAVRRPGAPAPSVSGDDYGVAMVNGLMFS